MHPLLRKILDPPLKHLFKMISLHFSFACEDSKKLFSCFCGAILQFYAEKKTQDAEDTEVSELWRSAPLHPVRCPV